MINQGYRQPLVWLVIAVHLVAVCGCSVTNRISFPANAIPVGSNFKITSVILKDGQIIEFDSDGGQYLDKTSDGKSYRAIVGTSLHKDVEIDPAKVLEVKFEQEESSGTGNFFVGMLVGVPIGAGLVVLIAALSLGGD